VRHLEQEALDPAPASRAVGLPSSSDGSGDNGRQSVEAEAK
jgi:hypothetical protein